MEHQDIDLIWAAQNSRSTRNAHLARTAVLPSCSRKFPIEKGPSLPAICTAPSVALPYDLSKAMHLHRKSKLLLVEDHIPVQFKLQGERVGRFGDCTFSVAVYVRSIDLEPNLDQLHWAVFGGALERENNSHLYFSPRNVAIRGWYQVIGDGEYAPEDLRKCAHRECIIAYDPQGGTGWLGEVAPVQELPTSGLIKDLDVFWRIIRQRYVDGFVESRAPDGITRWCRVFGGRDEEIECDAEKKTEDGWRHFDRKRPLRLNLVGIEYKKDLSRELNGDAFLCSDGTLLHTYHYSGEQWADKGNGLHVKEWKDGYYSNRFYPPGSPMIPKQITDLFESEMPTWFYKEEEARKAKAQSK